MADDSASAPTEDQLGAALVNAHNAGDEGAARKLAGAIINLRASQAPAAPAAPPPGPSAANPIDDIAHAAGPGTIARASLAPDPQVQIKRYADSFGQPESDFGIVGDHIVRRLPDNSGQYARVEPSVTGATDPIDMAKRAADWVSGGAGQAIPAITGTLGAIGAGIVGLPTGPGALAAAAAGGAGASGAGEVARQKLDHALAPASDQTKMDWGNVGWQAAGGGLAPVAGAAIGKVAGRVAPVLADAAAQELPVGETAARDALTGGTAPIGGNSASFGLSPRVVDALKQHIDGKQAELDQLRQDAQSMGVDLSLGQLTGSEAVKQSERQLLRQPETVQQVVDLRKTQNNEQIPGAVNSVLDTIAPDASPGQQVGAFRQAADDVVTQGLKERSDAARPLYEQALQGRSIAPLRDQFSALSDGADQAAKDLAQAQSNMESMTGLGMGDGAASDLATAQEKFDAAQAAKSQAQDVWQRALQDGTGSAKGAVWSPRIQQFLDDPVMQAGLKRGLEIQRLNSLAEGRPFNLTDFAVTGADGNGNPIVGAVPNMRTLDAGKKGLDAIIKDNTNDFGQMNQYANAVNGVRKSYLGEIDSLNPDYAPARAQWGSDTDALNAVKDGGVGFLNNMSGPDRQNIVNRVFSGQNLMPDDVASMRRQFAYAGKSDDWDSGVRSYIADKLADAVAPFKTGGEPSNVAGSLYKSLFEDRQADVLKAAMGNDANEATITQWNKLGRVLKAASNQLPEGSATATDTGAPGLTTRAVQGVKYMLHPASMGADLMDGLTKLQDPANARKLADTLLTPEGDKLLKALAPTTPGTDKANSILGTILTQAGVVGAIDIAGNQSQPR